MNAPADTFAVALGARLRGARLDRKLSIQEVADRALVSATALSSWESGAVSASFGGIDRVAVVLGVSRDYLAGRAPLELDELLEDTAAGLVALLGTLGAAEELGRRLLAPAQKAAFSAARSRRAGDAG